MAGHDRDGDEAGIEGPGGGFAAGFEGGGARQPGPPEIPGQGGALVEGGGDAFPERLVVPAGQRERSVRLRQAAVPAVVDGDDEDLFAVAAEIDPGLLRARAHPPYFPVISRMSRSTSERIDAFLPSSFSTLR